MTLWSLEPYIKNYDMCTYRTKIHVFFFFFFQTIFRCAREIFDDDDLYRFDIRRLIMDELTFIIYLYNFHVKATNSTRLGRAVVEAEARDTTWKRGRFTRPKRPAPRPRPPTGARDPSALRGPTLPLKDAPPPTPSAGAGVPKGRPPRVP